MYDAKFEPHIRNFRKKNRKFLNLPIRPKIIFSQISFFDVILGFTLAIFYYEICVSMARIDENTFFVITSVLLIGLTLFSPLNVLKYHVESKYDTGPARRRK